MGTRNGSRNRRTRWWGRDLVEHRFKIEKEGKYDVFIEMEDKKDVKIVGMINIDDD